MTPEQLEGREADTRADIFAPRRTDPRNGHGEAGVFCEEPGQFDRRHCLFGARVDGYSPTDDASGLGRCGGRVPRESSLALTW